MTLYIYNGKAKKFFYGGEANYVYIVDRLCLHNLGLSQLKMRNFQANFA